MRRTASRLFGGGLLAGAAVLLLLGALSCATVPITGRSQLHLIPDSERMRLSYTEYDRVLQSSRLSADAKQTDMLRRVGRRVRDPVEGYFADHGRWSSTGASFPSVAPRYYRPAGAR